MATPVSKRPRPNAAMPPPKGRAEEVLCNAMVAGRIFRSFPALRDALNLSHLVSRRISEAYSMRLLRELEIPDSESEAKTVTTFMFNNAQKILKVKGAARLSEVEGFNELRHVELQLKEPKEWRHFEGFLKRNRETLRSLVLFITEELNPGKSGPNTHGKRNSPRQPLLSNSVGNLPNLKSLRIVHDFDAGKFNVHSEVFENLLRVPSPHVLKALAFADFDIRGEMAHRPPKLHVQLERFDRLKVIVDPSLPMLRRLCHFWSRTVTCLDIKLLDFGVAVPYVEPMATRLSSFTIYLHLPRDSSAFAQLMRQMPHLTLLTLNIYFTSPEHEQSWPSISQSVLPRLRHLKIFTFQELDGEIFSTWFNAVFPNSVRRLDVESSLQTQDFVLRLNTPLKRLGVLLNNDELGNEVGEVVRELVKDTDFIAQHKNMKETLVNLHHLEYADTKQQDISNATPSSRTARKVNPDSHCVRLKRSDALRRSLRLLTLDGPYAAFRNVERCQFPALWKVELVWSKKGKERIEEHLAWLAEEQTRIATRKRKLEHLLGLAHH